MPYAYPVPERHSAVVVVVVGRSGRDDDLASAVRRDPQRALGPVPAVGRAAGGTRREPIHSRLRLYDARLYDVSAYMTHFGKS